ncbi:unnamed protein product [Mytilus edulis]|uniref:TIR domain-containing protein n=1 Tax=Mytilus edulis TaxID=6550 RepID=A0A8S3RMF7_MYTED|nr:unnamed protein product [Mytilus edulis]
MWGSYANNRNPIEMTNIGQTFLGEVSGFICDDSDFSNVSINEHPIFTVSEKIDQRTIGQYAPCGKEKNQKSWETDVYISFDDDSLEIRYFVLVILEQFFKRKKMTTYIPCRDAWPGRTEEDNIKCNMNKCKYCLVIQSSEMYDSDKSGGFTRRMEYKLAWDMFTKNKIKKILILTSDSKTPQQFQLSRSRALFRFGLGFVVPNRTNSLYDKIVLAFDEPLMVNSKYKVQRSKQIQNNLLKNKTQTDVTT